MNKIRRNRWVPHEAWEDTQSSSFWPDRLNLLYAKALYDTFYQKTSKFAHESSLLIQDGRLKIPKATCSAFTDLLHAGTLKSEKPFHHCHRLIMSTCVKSRSGSDEDIYKWTLAKAVCANVTRETSGIQPLHGKILQTWTFLQWMPDTRK